MIGAQVLKTDRRGGREAEPRAEPAERALNKHSDTR